MDKKDTITLIDNTNGHKIELPLLKGTDGPAAIDVRLLYKELGYFTFDPGFLSTASCKSAITYIDGEKGILRYRGYPIEQLAEKSSYLEVCYLLLHRELPTTEALATFENMIAHHSMLHEAMRRFVSGFRHDAHPMATMVGVVGALSAFYQDALDVHDPKARELAAYRLIAKMPTIAAWSYKHSIGEPFIYPDNSYSFPKNFLRMMFAVPSEPYIPNEHFAKALDLILILHADHEQNASTSTVRLTGSSEASPFAAISAGIASLWGPAHGGANEAVIHMLEEIVASDKSVQHYIDRAKDKNDRYRLMGFGHRVYKNYDPRAKLIRRVCHDLLDSLGADDINRRLLDVVMEIESIALKDEYFKERNLYPNVDYYSGIILKAIGIPMNMFTVVFAMARTVGWVTQWMEMMAGSEARIGRPRQLYIGYTKRDYIDIRYRSH